MTLFSEVQNDNKNSAFQPYSATSIIMALVDNCEQVHARGQCKKKDECVYYSPQVKTREFIRSTPEFLEKVATARAVALNAAEKQAQKEGKQLTEEEIRKIKNRVRGQLYRVSERGKATHEKYAKSLAGRLVTQNAIKKYRTTPKGIATNKRCNRLRRYK